MAIIGVASIRVKPDMTLFRKELTSELKSIKNDLTINVKAEVNTAKVREELNRVIRTYDGKDINLQAKLDRPALARVKAALASLGKGGAAFLGLAGLTGLQVTATLIKLAVVAGAAASAISGLTTILGGLGSALASVGIAAGAIALGGLASLVAVIGTIKFAVKGMGDAFKAIGEGDAKKLNEALKGMAPAAQEFVRAIGKLKPALDRIRFETQANLFLGLADEVKKTGPVVLKEFEGLTTGIASVLNNIGKDVAGFLRDPQTLGIFREITDNVTTGFRNASGAFKPMVSIITDLLRSATSLLPKLGTGFTNIITKFSNFIHEKSASGELAKFFQDGIDKAKQFGRIIRDFGKGISNIFNIAGGGAGGFLNTLERVATKFRDFTESVGGQKTLGLIVDTIGDLAGSFGLFLKALKPLLPLVGEFAKLLSDSLGKILEALGPIIESVGKVLLDTLKDVLPKITPFVIKLADAFGKILEAAIPLIKPLTDILVALTPLIDPLVDLAQKILPPLAKLLTALVPVIEALAKVLGFLVTVVATLVDGFAHLGDTIGEAFSNPGALVGKIVDLLNGNFKREIPRLGDTIRNGIDTAFAQIENLPGAATAAQNVMKRFADGIQNMFPTLRGALTQMTDLIAEALGQPPREQAKKDGAAITDALGGGIASKGEEMAHQAAAVIDRVFVLLGLKQPMFEEQGRRIAESLAGGISAGQGAVSGATSGIAGVVTGIMHGVSLYNQGTTTMESFISGMQARIQAIKQVLTSLTSLIPVWKGPMSKDKVLLTPTGEAIMDGFIVGLKSGIQDVKGVLTDTTSWIDSAFSPDQFSGSISATGNLLADNLEPSPVIINVDLNRELLQDFVTTEISESNRGVRRKVVGGVNP